jgi:hypothetical protein
VPSLIIRINRLYRPTMTPVELYDATRASWVLGETREKAKYASAVFEGIVKEVYEIQGWLPSGSTFNIRNPSGIIKPGRWEFVGRVAVATARKRYLDEDVTAYFKPGSQNPIAHAGHESY